MCFSVMMLCFVANRAVICLFTQEDTLADCQPVTLPIVQNLGKLSQFDVESTCFATANILEPILQCSTSNGNSSPTFRTLFRQSSAASLHISMSIVRVAFLPNISSKGVKQVDSCQDVLYAKSHVSKNSSHWLFFFAANLTSMF